MSEEQAAYGVFARSTIEEEYIAPKPIPGLIEGRMVHYVIPDDQKNGGQHRAATLCRVWDHTSGLCNLHVFWDGNNDNADDRGPWLGSIYYSAEPKPNTWHFMERA